MMRTLRHDAVACWELIDDRDPLLLKVRSLYETALDREERIPWAWLERAIGSQADWKPGQTRRHLVVASQPDGELGGFAFAMHLPGFGGYIAYIAVDPDFRGAGIGRRLFERCFSVLKHDATRSGEALPFVLWESHRSDGDEDLWNARMKLFDRVGGYRIDGLTLHSPNWLDDTAPAVPMQLFVAPMALPREAFDSAMLNDVADRFLRRIYHSAPGDAEYDASMPPTMASLAFVSARVVEARSTSR